MRPKGRAAFVGSVLIWVGLGGATHAQPSPAPLSFPQAVALAAAAPTVRLAEGSLALARGQLGAASAFVSGSLSTGYTQNLTSHSGGDFDPVTATATLNVLPFGSVADAVKQAEWAVQEAEAALEAARAAAVVDAATGYLEALRSGQEKRALEAAVGVAETALVATQTRLEARAASAADLLGAQIALSQAQNDLAEIALEKDQALAALSQTLGVSVRTVEGEPPDVALPSLGEVAAVLENRADVLAARLAVESANLSRTAARRNVLPSGDLGIGYGDDDLQLGAGFSTDSFQPSLELSYDPDGLPGELDEPTELGLSASIGMSIPLDSGVGATLSVAETAVRNAELALEQTRAQAGLELQAVQDQLFTAENSLAAGRALVQQRQLALETTRTRLRLGLVPASEVERAEAELLDAQVQRGRLEDNVLLARLLLMQTLALDPAEVF